MLPELFPHFFSVSAHQESLSSSSITSLSDHPKLNLKLLNQQSHPKSRTPPTYLEVINAHLKSGSILSQPAARRALQRRASKRLHKWRWNHGTNYNYRSVHDHFPTHLVLRSRVCLASLNTPNIIICPKRKQSIEKYTYDTILSRATLDRLWF